MLIFSLAPLTLPTAGWGKAPAAIIAPVAAPAVSMKPRRLTLLLSLIAIGLQEPGSKNMANSSERGSPSIAMTDPVRPAKLRQTR